MTETQRKVHAIVVPLLFAAGFVALMLLSLHDGK